MTALQWKPPRGHADIAPSQFERIENDGYLTIDAHWLIPALLRSVPIEGRVLEPAAGRGHLSLELRRAGLDVTSFDLHRYANPLVHDIGTGDIRRLTTLEGFAWVITNLPYGELKELATHLIGLGVRDRCGVALLVRAEWIVPKARRKLVHEHPHFAGGAQGPAGWNEFKAAHRPGTTLPGECGAPCRAWATVGCGLPASRSGSRCSSPCLRKGDDLVETVIWPDAPPAKPQ
jgi:hypothetical protein